MKLSKLGEFSLIRKIQELCPVISSGRLKGIGDDAAVVKTSAKKLLLTTDMLIEGVHFDLSFTTFYQLGHKFLAVNISDILAMGGEPEHFLVSLGIPANCGVKDVFELYKGIKNIAGKFGVDIVGGDTCASKKGLILSGTLTGSAKNPVTRSGAKAGDGIFVTKTLGDSAMGLAILKKSRKRINRFSPATHRLTLMKRHLMPQPAPVKNMSGITAMIDISDGLLADLGHICDESNLGAVIKKEKIPISRELSSTSKRLNKDPLRFALSGGEDYALLYTAPLNRKTDDYMIGEIIKKGRYITDACGRKTAFKAEGYEHFKKNRRQ